MKNASPAPISDPPTARCQILRSPDSESNPRTSRTAARSRSAASMTRRWGSRSAATPPTSTNASRPTLNRAVTSESSVGPPPSSITCQANATSHSPLPTSEIASPSTAGGSRGGAGDGRPWASRPARLRPHQPDPRRPYFPHASTLLYPTLYTRPFRLLKDAALARPTLLLLLADHHVLRASRGDAGH